MAPRSPSRYGTGIGVEHRGQPRLMEPHRMYADIITTWHMDWRVLPWDHRQPAPDRVAGCLQISYFTTTKQRFIRSVYCGRRSLDQYRDVPSCRHGSGTRDLIRRPGLNVCLRRSRTDALVAESLQRSLPGHNLGIWGRIIAVPGLRPSPSRRFEGRFQIISSQSG